MPIFTFIAENESAVPVGYLQRVTVSTVQSQPWQENGQFKGPEVWAFRLAKMAQPALPFVPNHTYKPYLVSRDAPQGDAITDVITAQPTVARAQTNAPYGEPVGNPGQNRIPLPIEGDKRRLAPAGDLEPLPDDAIPISGGDGLYGEMDGFGGTYEDISPTTGQVYRRPTGNERVVTGPAQQYGQ